MDASHSFLENPATTRESIMKATYKALCEHGYAGLTIARIAEDFEKSKSLLYHHYESKDDLLLDFLSYMLEEFERTIPNADTEPASERLERVFEHALGSRPAEESLDFMRALVELRAQGAHDDRFRDHFTESDQVMHDGLAEIIRDGVESGEFRDVDPDRVAAMILATLSGGMNQQVTAAMDHATAIQEELDQYVTNVLLPD